MQSAKNRAGSVGAIVVSLLVAAALTMLAVPPTGAQAPDDLTGLPKAVCGPGSDPETAESGRVPASDYESGRASSAYTCNTEVVGHVTGTGGFKVHRYVDASGKECAYYDTNLIAPNDTANQLASTGLGVVVLDMSDPANPVQTTTLATPAMQSPHESLELNQRRGLLAAVLGTAATYPGVVDIYDVSQDCANPVLQSSTPVGFLGHESGFAPDGLTYYTAGTAVSSVSAIDVTDPTAPEIVLLANLQSHGITISEDGNRAYFTPLDIGTPFVPTTGELEAGIAVVDVSSIQARDDNPEMTIISELTWPTASISQTAIPVEIDGSPYLVEIDEFVSFRDFLQPLNAAPGVARIIDISDETAPEVVSHIRLEVHDPALRPGFSGDPGAIRPYQGYAGHYCAVPQRDEPGIVACSMLGSGLRVFDIRDPLLPAEIAYFNAPSSNTSPLNYDGAPLALSAPAFVPERGEIWYSDNASGFWAVRLTNDVWPFAQAGQPSPGASSTPTPAASPAPTPAASPTATPTPGTATSTGTGSGGTTSAQTGMPATGGPGVMWLGLGLLAVGGAGLRLRRRRA